jgi:hypothetical protein
MCSASLVTLGFNLVGTNDCVENSFPVGTPNIKGDSVGTSSAPIDPRLSTLDAHGGPTATHLPMSTSPVVDAGNCPATVGDQRGYGNIASGLRALDDPSLPDLADGCDVGAVETGAVELLVFSDGFETGDMFRWGSTSP